MSPGNGVVLLVTFVRYPSENPCLGFSRFELGVVNFIWREIETLLGIRVCL